MNCKRLTALMVVAAMAAATTVGSFQLLPSQAEAEERPDQTPSTDDDSHDDGVAVVYQGVLQNEGGEPVSGVYPLTFQLYRDGMSAEPIWTEQHFVSVVDGRYQVRLGAHSTLRAPMLRGERWLGVELNGEEELLRDRITVEAPGDGDIGGVGDEDTTATADTTVAEAIGEFTAEDIEAIQRTADRALERTASPGLGDTRRSAGEEVGGAGGTSYELTCPEGYVATGIRGGAGRVVDSITVLCSPLE